MPERPVTPPWRKPIQELNCPNHRQGFYTELVNREDSAYQEVWPIKRGTAYASIKGSDSRVITTYAANPLYFLKQIRPGSSSASDFGASDQAVIWLWATDELAEDTYNADIDYPGESEAVSRYVRTSHVRRKDYEPTPSIAYGSTLTGLLSVAVGAAGTGYTQATGTIATGATAEAVCFGGAIIDWIVTHQGTGVTSGAALAITGDGTGATATARIQPATAILTHQEKKELPEDDPRSHDYVQRIRVYEILPGPWLPFTRYDDNLGPVQGQRRAVVNTGQVASLTATLKTTYEARDGSSYVSWEIQEAFGAGVTGFTAYPDLDSAELAQAVRGRIVLTDETIVAEGTSPDTGSLVLSSTVKARNAFLSDKTTVSLASLPPDEKTAYWDWVNEPLCVLGITHPYYCNNSEFFTVVTNYDTHAGSSVLRKHRRTVSYVSSPPDTTPNLSGAAFETADLRYAGKVISFALSNVLNDALSFDQDFYDSASGSACFWTEAYDFAATSPSATTFLAGAWYTKSFRPEEFGQSMWKLTKDEYYSATGNPAI